MKLNLEVTSETTSTQYKALARLFTELAGATVLGTVGSAQITPCASVSNKPQSAEAQTAPAAVEAAPETTVPVAKAESPKEEAKVTRRRRTKAEIETDEKLAADNAEVAEVADAEALAQQNNEAATAASTETLPADDVVADTAESVDADPNERAFTEGEVQALATLIARSKGPDVVRNKITELGGTRISALSAAQINKLGAFLESQK